MSRKWDRMDLANRVFISYSHKDRPFVNKLAIDLKSKAIDVWIDQYEILPGESIRRTLEDAIKRIDIFLLVLSPNSVSSGWVQEELDMIIGKKEPVLIPIIIKDCEIPPILHSRKWIRFVGDYDSKLDTLVSTIHLWADRKKDEFISVMISRLKKETSASTRERSESYAGIGQLALAIGKNREAKEILEKSIEIWPRNWDAHNFLSITLARLGYFSEAEEILRNLIRKKVQKARGYYNLACLYSLQAEALANTDRKKCNKLLDKCLECLSKSLGLKLISWMKHHAFRTDPVGDILFDPDLVFARRASSRIEEFFENIVKEFDYSWTGRHVGGGAGACFDGDMEVHVKDYGNMPICQVKCGDSVLSNKSAENLESFSTVWRKMRHWEKPIIIINNKLKFTAAQLVHVESKGWKCADELELGDSLTSLVGCEIVERIEESNKLALVHHLGLEGEPSFFVEDILVHNTLAKV